MANIGSASVLIVPKFDNLSGTVSKELGAAGTAASKSGEALGQKTTSGIGKGLSASGALIGVFSSLTTTALSSISSHLGDAAARFDTLNNYPKTMQNLGYSAEDAEASIQKMSDRLSTLPTTLDDMASTVLGIVVCTGDLEQATNAGLALNDMLIASGSNTQVTSAAMEQFRQILSKGTPDMQDWKSLISAMPAQMDQLAKSMLGPTATATDLYTALGGGGAEATITTSELLDAMIQLDNEGGDSITSFKEQAETAAGGVQTSMSNLSNAVTKGLTGIMDTIGKDTISGVFDDLKTAVNDAFKVINSGVSAALPTVKSLYSSFKTLLPTIAGASAAFVGLSKAKDVFSMMKTGEGTVGKLTEAFKLTAAGAGTFSESLSAVGFSIDPVSIGIAALSVAIGAVAQVAQESAEHQENLATATEGLNAAVERSTGLDDYSERIKNVGESSATSAMSVDELAESTAKHVESINGYMDEAENEIATLNTVQGIIQDCAGKTDLSTEAQGRLEWALQQVNDQFGLNISAADVAAGKYIDQNGDVQDLTTSLSNLIEEKKKEAEVDAISSSLTEAYTVRKEAAQTLASEQQKYNDALEEARQKYPQLSDAELKNTTDMLSHKKAVEEAEAQYDEACTSVDTLSNELGDAAAAASDSADAFDTWGSNVGDLFTAQLEQGGQSLSALKDDMRDLGVSVDDLGNLTQDQLTQLANDYDGTSASIVSDLSSWGVSMDDAKASAAEMASGIADAINGTSGMSDVMAQLGWNTDDFATACANAGLTTEDFAGMSADSFDQLAQKCDGDMTAVINTIASYNSAPLVDKDGNVNVTDNTLVDAQGHLLTYDGTGLYDKTAGAYVDSAEVVDSTDNVWTWDGTSLVSKSADATITGNAVTGDAQGKAENAQAAIDRLKNKTISVTADGNASDGSAATNIWNTVSAIGNLVGRTITNTITTINKTINKNGKATGGFRTHADGGIRYHASGGAIVNVPGTGYPLDWVGEDGAEAIVPLTNKKYSLPFARTLAEQMRETGAQAAQQVNLYLDGSLVQMDEYITGAITELVGYVKRTVRG
jgi:tape measure domain-containing protein